MRKNPYPPLGAKLKTRVLLAAALLLGTMSYAQSIYFNYTNGTNAAYSLEDVRKITFNDDVMNLHLFDGSTYSWNVSTISYYEYDETPVNVEQLVDRANAWQAVVFPNPVNSALHVQYNLPKAEAIRIALYDMQGKLILENNLGTQGEGQHQAMLDLSNVAVGAYVCRIIGENNSISKHIVKH
jgi:hypothetical protein